MNFKAQITSDIKKVFHNSKEFAEVQEIYYNGKLIKAPVVIDYSEENEKKAGNGNIDSLLSCDLLVFVPLEELEKVPRRGQEIEVSGEIYTITKVKNEVGEVVIYLSTIAE